MKSLRIKTKEEFIKEFGENWRRNTPWTNSDSMDYLFNYKLTKSQCIEFEKINKIEIDGWCIYETMIAEDSSLAKQIVHELYNSESNLISRSRKCIKLNQNN